MITDRAQMLEDFAAMIAIDATIEQALEETAQSHGYTIEEVRLAAGAKFGDLAAYKAARSR